MFWAIHLELRQNLDDFDIPQEARNFLTGLSKKAPSGSESDRIIDREGSPAPRRVCNQF